MDKEELQDKLNKNNYYLAHNLEEIRIIKNI